MDLSFRDWADLPINIVDVIVAKLADIFDYLRFCGVCPRWRYIAHDNLDYKVKIEILVVSRRKLPMLMFFTDENSERRNLFDVTNRKSYNVKLPFPFKNKFEGSSRGWLFCLGKDMVLTLVNPCTNVYVSLPVFKCPYPRVGTFAKKYFDYFLRKGILLSDPKLSDPNGFEVAVIYGGGFELAYFKSGSWNFVEIGTQQGVVTVVDMISYKGKFYAVNFYSKLIEVNTTCNTINTIIPPEEYDYDSPYQVYLVESQDGELLLVKRFVNPVVINEDYFDDDDEDDDDWNTPLSNGGDESSDIEIDSSDIQRIRNYGDDGSFPGTKEFKVFKMTHSLEDGCACWVEMDSIGEQALFVGDNHSISVSTIDFPNCLKNSIYFTTENHRRYFPYVNLGVNIEDARIFNLEDKSFHDHHVLEDDRRYMQPPIWFVPNPQQLNSAC